MANAITTAFWGVTINNPTESDFALIQNGYPDYCREIIHTIEEGLEGTRHIQAWVKLQRQQRMSFVKKLFPKGHFKPLQSDEYNHNSKLYAQKLDDTAVAAAVHRFNDPTNTVENTMVKVLRGVIEHHMEESDLETARASMERAMVIADYKFAKIFVSAVYKQMWKQFGHEMYQCVFIQHTHTHTHTVPEKIIADQDIEPKDASDNEQEREEGDVDCFGSDGEGYEDGGSAEDEGRSESGSSGYCSEDVG